LVKNQNCGQEYLVYNLILLAGHYLHFFSITDGITDDRDDTLRYKINDRPSIAVSILLAIQHFLTCFGSNVAVAFILSPALCITDSADYTNYSPDFEQAQLVKSKILSTIFFTGGISTLMTPFFIGRTTNFCNDIPGFLGYKVNISFLAEQLPYSKICGTKVRTSFKKRRQCK